MKKALILSLFVIVLAFVVPTPALAKTDTGPIPGSFWYGITTTFENVNLFFTFNAEKKAEKALNYAERHLTQAKTAVENENTNATEIALTDYEEKLKLATKSSKKIEDEERAEKLLTTIADNTARHQETLSEVLEKVPEEAREAIAKAIEVSKRGQEEVTQKIAELKGEVEKLKQEVAELKQNNKDEQTAEIKKLKKEVEELKTENKNKKQGETTSRLEIESVQLDTKKVKIEDETAKARAEAERLQKEAEARQVADEQKRLDLELQQQQEVQKQAKAEEAKRQEENEQIKDNEETRKVIARYWCGFKNWCNAAEESRGFFIEQEPLFKLSVEAIDAFLNNPTITNLHNLCIKSKTLPGIGSHEELSDDRESIISEKNSLYSNISLCEQVLGRPAISEPNKKYPYAWFTYEDSYLLDLDNFHQESDEKQILMVKYVQQYNDKIKSFSDYQIINFHCFCGLVSEKNILLEQSPKKTATIFLKRILSTETLGPQREFRIFLDSFSTAEKDLIKIKRLLTF